MSEHELLSVEELFHLALDAARNGEAKSSIELLKKAISMDKDNARVHYMLGAMHAEIGMYEQAVEDMEKAVNLDPDMEPAHFQLGLLYMTSGDLIRAEQTWSALDKYGESNYFFLFKRGILHLSRNEFTECITDLQNGIALNKVNEPLNNDMKMLIEQAEKAIAGNTQSEDVDGKNSENNHVFLTAYNTDEN